MLSIKPIIEAHEAISFNVKEQNHSMLFINQFKILSFTQSYLINKILYYTILSVTYLTLYIK